MKIKNVLFAFFAGVSGALCAMEGEGRQEEGSSETLLMRAISSGDSGKKILRAARNGKFETLRSLLKQPGANSNFQTEKGETALMLAAEFDDSKLGKLMVEELLAHGADPLMRNAEENRATQYARNRSFKEETDKEKRIGYRKIVDTLNNAEIKASIEGGPPNYPAPAPWQWQL